MPQTDSGWYCLTCRSRGFEVSKLGPTRCTFCDGTFGGNPPKEEEIKEARDGDLARSQNDIIHRH